MPPSKVVSFFSRLIYTTDWNWFTCHYFTVRLVKIQFIVCKCVINLLQSYGGNIIAMYSDEDIRLVKDLRREESMISSALPPSLWTVKRDFMPEVRKGWKKAD